MKEGDSPSAVTEEVRPEDGSNEPSDAPVDLSHYLAELQPRQAPELRPKEPRRPVTLDSSDDVAAAAVGVLMLERLTSYGGTVLGVRELRSLRERLTEPFRSLDVMAMEIEAYNALTWVARLEFGPEVKEARPHPPSPDLVYYDPEMPIMDLLRRAIDEEFDVEIHYYTQSRGELNKRRISPTDIQAETYLHAYCHARRSERVFRISRIAEIRPVDGRPTSAKRRPAIQPERGDRDAEVEPKGEGPSGAPGSQGELPL